MIGRPNRPGGKKPNCVKNKQKIEIQQVGYVLMGLHRSLKSFPFGSFCCTVRILCSKALWKTCWLHSNNQSINSIFYPPWEGPKRKYQWMIYSYFMLVMYTDWYSSVLDKCWGGDTLKIWFGQGFVSHFGWSKCKYFAVIFHFAFI